MKKRIYVRMYLLFIMGSIFGCAAKITFEPSELPPATIGQPYHTEFKIVGGGASISSFYAKILPSNGLTVEAVHVPDPYSFIKVYGIAQKEQDMTLEISGSTFGTMVSGKTFSKTYIIKVKKDE